MFPELNEASETIDTSGLQRFGFFPLLKHLCKNDITKRDEVLNISCYEIYTWLAVEAVENEIKKRILKRNNL